VSYTADGTRLVTSSISDKEDVCVWDARTHRKLLGLKGHKHGAGLVAVSADGKRLVSLDNYAGLGSLDVAVWELATGKLLHKHRTRFDVVERASFLPDGRTLLVAERQRICVWDTGASAGDRVRDVGDIEAPSGEGPKPGTRPIPTTTIDSGGRFGVVGETGRPAHLLDILTGQDVWHIDGGADGGRRIAFSPDGRTIAQPSWGARIELLDLPSEKAVLTLGPLLLPVSRLVFSPDGKRLATVSSGSRAATIYLWDLSDIVGRPLPKPKVGPGDMDRRCKDLAGDDARTAYRAVWALAGTPEQALSRLRALIGDLMRTTPADIDGWIAGLDDDRFAAREAAAARLRSVGTAAVPQMQAALNRSPSPEKRRRLEAIVGAIREAPVPSDWLFAIRGRMVLEQIGTPEARKLLDEWAAADPRARPEAEARAVVERVIKQRQPDQ
jgi:hypothetical protein